AQPLYIHAPDNIACPLALRDGLFKCDGRVGGQCAGLATGVVLQSGQICLAAFQPAARIVQRFQRAIFLRPQFALLRNLLAQGERARDIVGRMDIQRLSAEKASELAALDGPMLRPGRASKAAAAGSAYILPARGKLVSGFNELNATGYRERGVRIALADDMRVVAPAAGTVSFAGRYRSYGRIVIIEHGNGWNSLITHLGSTQVKKGQAVQQGFVLGSAKPDMPEIGVELRKNGRVMDIATILG
ncbi:MAG: hypothetical protein RLZZ191_1551, partial [Pseudomonadota bacterium]